MTCRLCKQASSPSLQEEDALELFWPCKCAEPVHPSCLQNDRRWDVCARAWSECPKCGHVYELVRKPLTCAALARSTADFACACFMAVSFSWFATVLIRAFLGVCFYLEEVVSLVQCKPPEARDQMDRLYAVSIMGACVATIFSLRLLRWCGHTPGGRIAACVFYAFVLPLAAMDVSLLNHGLNAQLETQCAVYAFCFGADFARWMHWKHNTVVVVVRREII